MKPEKDVQTEIMKYAQSKGWKVAKVMKANTNGFPDLVMCVKGLYVECEVKAERFEKDPEKQMSPWQHKHKALTEDADGIFICAASLEQFKSKLKDNLSIW